MKRSRSYKFVYVCPNYFVGTKYYKFHSDEEAIEFSKTWNEHNDKRHLVWIEVARTTKNNEEYYQILHNAVFSDYAFEN